MIHGVQRVDDYQWLRNRNDPEVIAHLHAENSYTDAMLAPTTVLQQQLYDEFLSRLEEDDTDVAYRKGEWLYYNRTETGKEYRIYCRRPAGGGDEQIMLDLNSFAGIHEYVSPGAMEVSDDGHLFAYAIDFTGFRDLHLYVKDLRTGAVRRVSDDRVTSIAWAADDRTLFFCVEDESKRPARVCRFDVFDPQPVVVFDEADRQFGVSVGRTRSGGFVAIASASADTSDAHLIDADRPDGPPRLVAERIAGQEYYLDHAGGDELLIRANDTGRNFRLVSACINAADRAQWRELIPHRADVMIEDHNCFSRFAVLSERTNGLPRLTVRTTDGRLAPVPVSEAVCNIGFSHNEVFESTMVRYVYESPITPISTFDFDTDTQTATLLKQEPVPNFDSSLYEVTQAFAAADDGTRIPISIVRRKDLAPGPQPLWLQAYGAYGLAEADDFNPARFSLLDRGITFAIAHIRGGGEMGKIWHEQGRLMHKRSTFTDFIACAEHLIAQRITSSDRLAISGYSAGGLTMGSVLNMRPDLFRAAIVGVPFVDVINTMLDETLPLTTQEYLEWGNPNEKSAFEYMLSYSPYDNIKRTDYPAIYVFTGLNDSQVMYWEPAKYVAKLRATKTDNNPLLLRCVMAGGHGGPSGRYDDLREEARQYAFAIWQLGLTTND